MRAKESTGNVFRDALISLEIDEFCPACIARAVPEKVRLCRPHGDSAERINGRFVVHKGVPRPAFCPECGYSTKDGKGLTKADLEARVSREKTKEMHKNGAIGFFNQCSLLAKMSVTNDRFSNFKTPQPILKQVGNETFKNAKSIASGEPIHLILQGKTGTGKTHLSMACVWEIWDRTGYRFKDRPTRNPDGSRHDNYREIQIVFASWPLLIQEIKDGISSPDVAIKAQKTLSALQVADVAVIDDLGAEPETSFNFQKVDDLFQIREDLPTIITTNLSFDELKKKYDDRTVSRIRAHAHTISFKGVKDYRQREDD